jgi:hypothetical protein
MPTPIHDLPDGYKQVRHVVLLSPDNLLRINLAALLPLVGSFLLMAGWMALVLRLRGVRPGGFGADWAWWVWLLLIFVGSIIIHEGLHGAAIRWTGHRPRFGMILSKAAFFATADQALFRRSEFIVIALAPIVGITCGAMALMLFVPDTAAYYIGLGAVLNAGNSIGDLWMTAAVLRYSPAALIRDEADSIRIYER